MAWIINFGDVKIQGDNQAKVIILDNLKTYRQTVREQEIEFADIIFGSNLTYKLH